MNKLLFKSEYDSSGEVSGLKLGGFLVMEKADILKSELLALYGKVGASLKVSVVEIEDIDLSAIQLLIVFFRGMAERGVHVDCDWDLSDEQKALFIQGGLSAELLVK